MSHTTEPNELFSGTERFVVQRRIGSGGMGVVYQALDRERHEVVALKTLRHVEGAAIMRFKQEFRALTDVSHPNLISLYELISVEDRIFFTMELVNGVSFLRWVREQAAGAAPDDTVELSAGDAAAGYDPTPRTSPGKKVQGNVPETGSSMPTMAPSSSSELDLSRLRPALRQLAEGVSAIHDASMLHRDLKPSNVLVGRDGRVKILDFGLVTQLALKGTSTAEEGLAGTAAYMSPEQGARLSLTPASDWYSVGVMLYEALTGRLPFVGSPLDLLMDKQQFEPPPPHQLFKGAPSDLDALCVELLRRDPEARPSARDVLRRLGSSHTTALRASSGRSAHGDTALFGRERHVAQLGEAFEEVLKGHTVVHFVHGSSGMGKSALVRRFLEGLEERAQAVVLTGRCYERESVPYKAVDSLIDGLAQHLARMPRLEAEGVIPRDVLALARLFPVLRQVEAVTATPRRAFETPDPLELRRRAFNALRELLARLTDRLPVVLAIDDLQWGDADSAALLASLLRAPDAPALLLVGCHRTEDQAESPFLNDFRAAIDLQGTDVRELEVGPLGRFEARNLALVLLETEGASGRLQSERIADEAAGNPFFIHELARHVREGEGTTPELISLDEVLRARLRRLPEPSGRLLSMVATAGRPLLLSVAQRAAEVRDPTALSVLKAGNLVRTRGPGEAPVIECYHDRIREAATALLDEQRLKHAHLRLAIALEASPQPDAEALALHFRDAGEPERAAEFAGKAAARASESLAFDRAARLYRLALELHPSAHAGARKLRVLLGDALANAGRGAAAAKAYLAATDKASEAEALDLRRRAASQLLISGHFTEGMATLKEVLAAAGMKLPATPGAAMVSLLWRRARIRLRGLSFREREQSRVPPDELSRVDIAEAATTGLGMVDSIRGACFQTLHLLLALESGEPNRIARTLCAEACFISFGGTRSAGRSAHALKIAEPLIARLDTPEVHATFVGASGIVAFQEGKWRQSLVQCSEAEQILRDRCTGLTWELTTVQIFTLFANALLGEIRTVSQRVTALLKEADERGNLYFHTNVVAAVGFHRWLSVDDPERARSELDEALRRFNVPDAVLLQHFNATMSEVLIDFYEGQGVMAWERMDRAWKSFDKAFMFYSQILRTSALAARGKAALAAAQCGRPELLRVAVADARRLAREKVSHATANARLILAGVARVRGELERAVVGFAEAEQLFRDADMALHEYGARWERGRLIGGDAGGALIADARGFYRAQGIVDAERALPTTTALFALKS